MMKYLVFLSLLGLLYVFGTIKCMHPLILLPGDAGSQMMVKLDKPADKSSCPKKTKNYITLWLDISKLYPGTLHCFAENMRLTYNNVTRKTKNAIGVDIKIPGFGNTSTIEYLDPDTSVKIGHYYKFIVDSLVENGLKRGISVRGAPYDFRKAPNELQEYFANLKNLIEKSYIQNGNKSNILIGHSLGCNIIVYFLNHQTQAWKDKYISRFVSISGPYGGSVKALLAFISGYNLGSDDLNPISLRLEQRTNPSIAFLMPSQHYWNASEVLVKNTKRQYTVKQYKELFTDIGWNTGYEMWLDTKDLISSKNPPGVEVHCLYGTGVKTPKMLKYDQYFPNWAPSVSYENGDGTVNLRSLEICLEWAKYQKQMVYHKRFPGVDHLGIMKHKQTTKYIFKLLNTKKYHLQGKTCDLH